MSEDKFFESSSEEQIYELGLVMAGAISAGAYTAGVADFLVEALDQWDKFNKERGHWLHEVKLRVISGASAGGMTGSILTAAFGGAFPPVKERPKPGEISKNPLYRAWVQQIDIKDLLESRDIEQIRDKQHRIQELEKRYATGALKKDEFEKQVTAVGPVLISLLDSTRLKEIANQAIDVTPDISIPLGHRRPYLPDPFQLYLSIANLRGVPYALKMEGGVQRMVTHADFMHFAMTANRPPDAKDDFLTGDEYINWKEPYSETRSYAFWLNPTKYGTKNWERLASAALATGAFPFGLAPVKLGRLWEEYKFRTFPVSTFKDGRYRQEFRSLEPEAVPDFGNNAYDFICVDGGLLDNSPSDLAHRVLGGDQDGHLERDMEKCKRSIILIAPFPDSKEPEAYKEPNGVLRLTTSILNSLTTQVRFNPEELILATDPTVGSRYLIAPERNKPPLCSKQTDPSGELEGNIACGCLEGFGGFLSEDFRHHDFMLGRRNCQWFLKTYFTLPETNTLFNRWDAGLREAHYVRKPNGGAAEPKRLPIIPCMGTAAPEVHTPDWPRYSKAQLGALERLIGNRYVSFGNLLIGTYVRGGLTKQLLRWGIVSQRRKVASLLRQKIADNMTAYGIPGADEPRPSRTSNKWVVAALAALSIFGILLLVSFG
jgi:hypothetical protein